MPSTTRYRRGSLHSLGLLTFAVLLPASCILRSLDDVRPNETGGASGGEASQGGASGGTAGAGGEDLRGAAGSITEGGTGGGMAGEGGGGTSSSTGGVRSAGGSGGRNDGGTTSTASGGTGAVGLDQFGCPTKGGAMVRIAVPNQPVFCIDATEVTVANYDAWADNDPDFNSLPECEANQDVKHAQAHFDGDNGEEPDPSCTDPQGSDPVLCVDWCDAATYCKAMGKHLCGRLRPDKTSTKSTRGTFTNNDLLTTNEWYIACTESPPSGMLENNNEWGDACGSGFCVRRGIQDCNASVNDGSPPFHATNDISFRCCADVAF